MRDEKIRRIQKEAVKKYLDGQSAASIPREIGVNENTIHKWKKEILSANGEVDQEKLLMRKRIFELEQENAPLKKGGLLCEKRVKRYEFIEKEKNNHSISRLWRAMQVSEDAFYAWRSALA
jgi:transposase